MQNKALNITIVRKDPILREIFSNFYFDHEKIVGFSVKEPFASLLNVKIDDVVAVGGGSESFFELSPYSDYTTVPMVMEGLDTFRRRMSEIMVAQLSPTEAHILYQL